MKNDRSDYLPLLWSLIAGLVFLGATRFFIDLNLSLLTGNSGTSFFGFKLVSPLAASIFFLPVSALTGNILFHLSKIVFYQKGSSHKRVGDFKNYLKLDLSEEVSQPSSPKRTALNFLVYANNQGHPINLGHLAEQAKRWSVIVLMLFYAAAWSLLTSFIFLVMLGVSVAKTKAFFYFLFSFLFWGLGRILWSKAICAWSRYQEVWHFFLCHRYQSNDLKPTQQWREFKVGSSD